MNPFNLHTHTQYCDGSDYPEAYVQTALECGMSSLGFSSHAPVPFSNHYAIPDEEALLNYCQTIKALKSRYSDKMDILLSLEFDHIPGVTDDFETVAARHDLEYTIGSIHFVKATNSDELWFIDGPKPERYEHGLELVFQNDIKRAVTTYFHQINDMVISQKPDIIGHFDKIKMHNQGRFFIEEDQWYRSLLLESLEIIAKSNSIIEINTRGIYKERSGSFFPDGWVLEVIKNLKIPLTISTDAHKPSELTLQFVQAVQRIKDYEIGEVYTFREAGWKSLPII